MLLTALTNLPTLQTLQVQPSPGLGSPAIGGIIGSVIGLLIGVLAATINYRRNHSIFYALLAFLFSEFYLAFVFIGFIIKKLSK
jgi:hypothetical protein